MPPAAMPMGTIDDDAAAIALRAVSNLVASRVKSQRRQNVTTAGGSSYYLGLLQKGVAVAHREDEATECASILNQLVPADMDFTWTSLAININTVSSPHQDRNKKGTKSLIIGLGDFEEGNFVQDNQSHNIRQRFVQFEPTMLHHSTGFTGQRVSVVYFTHRCWNEKFQNMFAIPLSNMNFKLPPLGAPITMDPGVASPH